MGGAEIQLLTLVKGLDKKQFDAVVAVFYRGRELDRNFEHVKGVPVFFLEKKNRFDFFYLSRFAGLIKSANFDIIQPYNVSARLIGIIAAKIAHIPYIVVTERTARALYSSFGSRVYQFFETYAMRHVTVLVANSKAGRHYALSRGLEPKRTLVIYNGIDPKRLERKDHMNVRLRYGISPKRQIVGTISRIEEQKDPRTLIDTAKLVTKRLPDTCFMLVGDGPLLSEMQTLAKVKGVSDKVIFTGYQVNIADFLKEMNVFVLCSKKIEGCSNSIIEAMAMGKPVVATDVGGTKEIIKHGENGFLVEPENPAQLAEAILKLLTKKQMSRRMAERARMCALENFSQRTMISAYEKLYKDLARQG
jgi:glycosyltransferase involved in cell wall biosynthesis